ETKQDVYAGNHHPYHIPLGSIYNFYPVPPTQDGNPSQVGRLSGRLKHFRQAHAGQNKANHPKDEE
ncbi:MAG: hypothetical protein RL747_532, partial [Bacteroidota bacterium]